MATQFISNSWLMPTNANKDKLSNYSLDFDGVDEFINIGSDLFTGSGISEISMSLWVKFVDASPSDTIIAKDDVSGTNPRNFLIQAVGSTLYFNTSTNGTSFSSSQTVSTSTYDFLDQQWHHFVFVYKAGSGGSAEKSIYIDGTARVSDTSSAFSDIFNTTNVDIRIARRGDNARPLDGNITEVAIFDYALSASQVTELYGTGSAVGNPMAITNGRKPVAYYPLGNAAFNGEFLASNGAEQDYVFTFNPTGNLNQSVSLNQSYGYSNITVSAWVKMTSNTNSLIYDNRNDNNNRIFIYYNASTKKFQWGINNITFIEQGDEGGGDIELNKWYHVLGTYDETTSKLYVNNVSTQVTDSTTVNITSQNATIGALSTVTTILEARAQISNVQIFNTALSATGSNSVETLYNYGTPLSDMSGFTSLQGWWKLDASATFDGSNWSVPDDSSNSNTGTSSGMTAANLVQSDLIINAPFDSFALDFDGTNDYISVPNSTDFDYGTGDFTWSFWLNVDTHVNYAGLFYFASSGAPYRLKIQSDSTIFLDADTNDVQIADLGTGLAGSGWHSLIFVRNSGTITTYLDGSQVDSVSYSHALNSGGNPLIIANNAGSYLNGKLSNISIYNSALTSAQVTTLYNNRKPFDLNTFEVTPVSWWRLGAVNSSFNGSIWTVLDEIGSNNGTGNNLNPAQSALVDGVGATGSGTSSGMSSGTNKTGDAPYSTSNAVSYNMSVTAESTSVPT